MKDIKLRIKSVESTRQITKAMQLVATSKLRRAKERMENSQPYGEISRQAMAVALRTTGAFADALHHHERAEELLKPLTEAQLEADCRREHAETRRAAGLPEGWT